jgi:hypothetical protein
MDTESRPNLPFRFFINGLWKISGQLPAQENRSWAVTGSLGHWPISATMFLIKASAISASLLHTANAGTQERDHMGGTHSV